MLCTPTLLAQATLTNSIAVLYTVPANRRLTDCAVYLFNHDTVARTVQMKWVPSGASALTDYTFLASQSIPANAGILVQTKQALHAGGTIRAFADVASKVSAQISGDIVNTATDTPIVALLYQGLLATSLTTAYTVTPGSLMDAVLWLCNTDVSSRTVTLEFIPSGQSANMAYRLLGGYVMTTGSTLFLQARQVIAVGGTIRAYSDVVDKVAMSISGVQL